MTLELHEAIFDAVEAGDPTDSSLGPLRTANDRPVVATTRGIVRSRSFSFIERPAAHKSAGKGAAIFGLSRRVMSAQQHRNGQNSDWNPLLVPNRFSYLI